MIQYGYHLHSNSIAKVVLFSVVSVCVFVNAITLESFKISSYGATYCQKLGQVRKWVHSDALADPGVWREDLSPSFGQSGIQPCGARVADLMYLRSSFKNKTVSSVMWSITVFFLRI